MNNEGRFHEQRIAEKMENGKWKFEKQDSQYETANRREKTGLTERSGVCGEEKSSHEEIENEEKEADQKKHRAAIDGTARQAAQRVEKGSRDGLESGFFADAVERTHGGIAGEVATENGNLILHPDGELATVAPHQCGTRQE